MQTDIHGKTALHYAFDVPYDLRALPFVNKVLEQINFDGLDWNASNQEQKEFCRNAMKQQQQQQQQQQLNVVRRQQHRMMTMSQSSSSDTTTTTTPQSNVTWPIHFVLRYKKLLRLITMLINVLGPEFLSIKDTVRSETALSFMFHNIHAL